MDEVGSISMKDNLKEGCAACRLEDACGIVNKQAHSTIIMICPFFCIGLCRKARVNRLAESAFMGDHIIKEELNPAISLGLNAQYASRSPRFGNNLNQRIIRDSTSVENRITS